MSLISKFAFWIIMWIILILIGVFTPWHIRNNLIFPVFGILLIIYGLLLNSVAGRTLKKYGYFEIRKGIKAPEKLVTRGIYSCMRHPAQFGSILFGVGLSLLTNNIFAILSAGWYVAIALYFILSIEEKETFERFGKPYIEYVKKVPPFKFCFKL